MEAGTGSETGTGSGTGSESGSGSGSGSQSETASAFAHCARAALLAAALISPLASLAACGGSTPFEPREVDTSPVPVADPGSPLPEHWERGVFAEIFVRGYQDSDGDGIGDLRGLINRLDYLKDLGVSGLWLMPITESQDRDHGYSVADYRDVEADYGTLEDLDALIAAAHARGIGVILDYVMNHSAAKHPAFVNSANVKTSPFREWYLWEPHKPSGWQIYGSDPWKISHSRTGGFYFAAFFDQMPDWNLRNPEVVSWHHDNLRFWLNRGVDGFRFDAVGHLVEHGPGEWEDQPENYALMGEVHQLLQTYQRRYLVCESPPDPVGFAAPTACGSAFAFGRQGDFIGAARGDLSRVTAVASDLRSNNPGLASMASNHDSFAGARLFEQVGGNLAQYKLAAASYLLQGGPAFIYYGEEIGMAGAATLNGDPKLRTPMSWTNHRLHAGFSTTTPFRELSANSTTFNVESQRNDPNSLLAFYKTLLALRRQLPALERGLAASVEQDGLVLTFRRTLGADQVAVAINYSKATVTATVTGLPPNAQLTRAYPAGEANATADVQGRLKVQLPAQSLAIFSLR